MTEYTEAATVGIGIFGSGRIGQVHAANVALNPGSTLLWVCDPRLDAATELAQKYGARATDNPNDVLSDPAVQAVLVGSSTPTHMDLTVQSVRAGKRVLCEKPLDLELDVIDAARADAGPDIEHVMVGFNRRFDPNVAEVHRRVEAGEIGQLEQLTIISRDPTPPPGEYLAVSGGMFRDMTIHDFDMARFFLGEITSVYATGSALFSDDARAVGDVDSASLILTNAAGVQCQIINSRHCGYGYDQRLEAFGSLGSLRVGNQRDTTVVFDGASATDVKNPIQNFFLERYAAAYQIELQHFLTSIASGVAPSPSFEDGREAVVCALAAQRSLSEGRVVALSEFGL
ncbi:inositol 2-dehydrogenase [Lysinibacter cavernae]|uniref:Myo-inositol 2-dehydrogenase/D-chiro-inositol 1-dehydrogenase n=1 Tax=Lysinibacter cavernae TaxID=1640652 RepID=A0A7X5QZX9_9MICO|nr:inositol 2-dehydrogenase [Lysinibacter cavernae]NIH53074.1 myo-inositol 2-dehydrogenase/D-chiro-inositol 1-dehydrogenase [Lysinibacter cavernae]